MSKAIARKVMRRGRPTKLTPEIKLELLALRSKGVAERHCADRIQVDFSTLQKWIADDPEFSGQWKGCLSYAIEDVIDEMRRGDNKALQWLKRVVKTDDYVDVDKRAVITDGDALVNAIDKLREVRNDRED